LIENWDTEQELYAIWDCFKIMLGVCPLVDMGAKLLGCLGDI